jgi:hypothetical protein
MLKLDSSLAVRVILEKELFHVALGHVPYHHIMLHWGSVSSFVVICRVCYVFFPEYIGLLTEGLATKLRNGRSRCNRQRRKYHFYRIYNADYCNNMQKLASKQCLN